MAINLPDGPRKQAFRTFSLALQNDPTLRRVVKTWRVWDGTSDNPLPNTDMMPTVGLRLVGGSIERIASDGDLPTDVQIRTTPTIYLDIWTAGTDGGDVMNLYDAIDRTLFPADGEALEALTQRFWAVGIMDWQPVKDVLPESIADYTAESVHGAGAYQLSLVLSQ